MLKLRSCFHFMLGSAAGSLPWPPSPLDATADGPGLLGTPQPAHSLVQAISLAQLSLLPGQAHVTANPKETFSAVTLLKAASSSGRQWMQRQNLRVWGHPL